MNLGVAVSSLCLAASLPRYPLLHFLVLLPPRRVSFGMYAVVKTLRHIVNLPVDESLIGSRQPA
jgi:hypothetical protein